MCAFDRRLHLAQPLAPARRIVVADKIAWEMKRFVNAASADGGQYVGADAELTHSANCG